MQKHFLRFYCFAGGQYDAIKEYKGGDGYLK